MTVKNSSNRGAKIYRENSFLVSKSILRAIPYTLHTEYAFGTVFSFSGVIGHIHVHRAYTPAFSAVDAFILFTLDADQRVIAHGFEEHCNRTNIFAESPVVFKCKRKQNTDSVICYVPCYERQKHDPFDITDFGKKQRCHKDKRQCKRYIADPPYLLSWLLRNLIWKEIKHHCCPAGIAAPSSSKYQRPEDLCNGVVDSRSFKYPCEKIVPKPFDLHILTTYKPEEYEHVQSYKQLNYAPCMLVLLNEQENTKRYGQSDIAEIEQIE